MSSRVFTPGLLEGHVVLISGAAPAVAQEMEGLGATIETCAASQDESEVDSAVEAVRERHGQIHALVSAPGDSFGLSAGLEASWLVTHAVATRAFIPDDRGGTVITVTDSAAVENLMRVLSIEWARFGIKLSAIRGADTQETAWLAAYLASPAGDYVSGAVLGA